MSHRERFLKGRLYELNLSDVHIDGAQPRKYADEEALRELTSSIEKNGVLQPVLVRRGEGGSFILVSGERRYQASLRAGLTTIPAILTDGGPGEVAIVEKLLREDHPPLEEAGAIARLKETPFPLKDSCRSTQKASRDLLLEISKLTTSAKMKGMYKRFEARGADGRIRSRKRSRTIQPVDLDFIRRYTHPVDVLPGG